MIIDFGFNPFFNEEVNSYILEIKIGTQIQQQMLSGTDDIIQTQFMQLMNEVGQNNQPIKIRIIRKDKEWNQYRNKMIELENYIQFANKKYMSAFADEFKEE